jgi:hypothetical protein
MASMASVTTRGFSVGTFTGSASLVVTLGYGLGVVSPVTLIGSWSNVIPCQSVNQRIECQSVNSRIECQSSNRRIETP